MIKITIRTVRGGWVPGLLMLLGGMGFAGMAAGAGESAPQLEEVIVTAQKRQETLKEVPISITAFTAKMLDEMQIKNIVDVSSHTPNFTFLTQGASNTSMIVTIRGVGNSDSNLSSDAPIGIYIDGVLPNAHMTGNVPDLLDIERVEVLRGPQGTLYGRNTPSGAINFVTRKPSGELGLDLSAGVGNYNLRTGHFALDTPRWDLGDAGNLAMRVNGTFLDRDGWMKDVGTGDWFDSRSRQSGRVALRWTVNDDLLLDYDYSFSNVNELPPAIVLTNTTLPFLEPYVESGRRSAFGPLSIGHCNPAAFGKCGNRSKLRVYTHALHAAWTVSPALILKSISSYSGLHSAELTDFDGSPFPLLDSFNLSKLGTVSQEFNVSGATADGNLNYVGGLYFSHEHGFNTNPGAYGGLSPVQLASTFSLKNDSRAVYGQVDWRPDVLDHKMTFIAGLRYTQETRKLINASYVFNDAFLLAALPYAKKDYSKLTPAFTVKYDFTDETNGYFRYAKGWRSGGFNGRAGTQEALNQPFQPEDTTSYEIGMKGSFFEKRLDFTAAAFFTKYDNLQIVQTVPLANGGYASINANVGKIDVSGFELELNALLTPKLNVYASYGYVDTNIKQYDFCVPTAVPGECTLQNIGNNRQLYYTPRSNAAFGVDYRIADTSYGTWKVRFDANWRDEQSGGAEVLKFRPFGTDPAAIPAYGLVNGRFSLQQIPVARGQAQVSVWVKNMLNADTAVSAVNLEVIGLGYSVTRFLEPRTFGVDFDYHY